MWGTKKVLRTKSFLPNLLERAREAWRAGKALRRCPECGAPMVERESKMGNRFLGCARFPDCRHTERLETLQQRAAGGGVSGAGCCRPTPRPPG